MPPRPRPLPKSAPAPNATQGPSSSATHHITYDTVKDDDEMFMRNRGRNKDDWAKLRKLSKEKEKKSKSPARDSHSDSESDPHRKRKKGETSPLARPRWQTDKKFTARLLSQDLSDGDTDSDDSITIEGVNNTQNNKLKRKRTDETRRARSKSITPPPDIPQYQLESGRNVLSGTLGPRREPSPEIEMLEEEDTVVFDPQLAKIVQNVKSQSELIGHTASSVEPTESDSVDITVRWEPHPLNEHGKHEAWGFKLNRTDNFSELFESVAEEASILADKLVMTYRGKRFFSSVSPQTLNIWSDAEFTAYDLPTFEYKRQMAEERLRSQSMAAPNKPTIPKISDPNIIDIGSDDDEVELEAGPSDSNYGDDETDAGAAEPIGGGGGADDEDQDKFKLVLRSGLTSKDIMLNVRSTTKCSAIVKAFLKKAGLADRYPAIFADTQKKAGRKSAVTSNNKMPHLSIDGEKANDETEIGDFDLEEGDMVDVVGL